jgi:hypothetical protein
MLEQASKLSKALGLILSNSLNCKSQMKWDFEVFAVQPNRPLATTNGRHKN